MNRPPPRSDTCDVTPAAQMEAQERALVRDDRCDDHLKDQAAMARKQHADAPPMQKQGDIEPKVIVNTDQLSQCHEPTLADEMEAEERERVIEDSVADTLAYAQTPLSDEEIRARSLTRADEIHPAPKDGKSC